MIKLKKQKKRIKWIILHMVFIVKNVIEFLPTLLLKREYLRTE
jgi:hypothetical protein